MVRKFEFLSCPLICRVPMGKEINQDKYGPIMSTEICLFKLRVTFYLSEPNKGISLLWMSMCGARTDQDQMVSKRETRGKKMRS